MWNCVADHDYSDDGNPPGSHVWIIILIVAGLGVLFLIGPKLGNFAR